MKIENCARCGTTVYVGDLRGIKLVGDLQPLDAQGVTATLLDGREVYAVRRNADGKTLRLDYGTTAVLGEAHRTGVAPELVGQHPCGTSTRPLRASDASGGQNPPGGAPRPSDGRRGIPSPGTGQPSSGHWTEHSTAPNAARRDSNGPLSASQAVDGPQAGQASGRPSDGRTGGPVCDNCSQPCADGTYAAVHLGELVAWAVHVDNCAG